MYESCKTVARFVVSVTEESISKNERKSLQDGGENHDVVRFRDRGTEEKTGGRVGGSRG